METAAPLATVEEPTTASTHRRRLFEGMARAVAAQGFAACTIADIVREAAVSRRTFYEHFQTKADCLIAMYESASRNALRQLQAMLDPTRHWQQQVEGAMTAYLGVLADNPVVLRALFIDILSLGTEGLAARRRVNHEIAEFLLSVVNPKRDHAVMSPTMAMAVVGGINELVLQLIEQDRIGDMQSIADTTSALIRAVVGGEVPRG
ncbi:TetR/AcrR family transcriptional regulator [Curvibacter sp. APW13]|uniref:TetR/AcrR family transcriptional regulator n=1 Tax=Curvibacter sp. APW13 TaxID=3077236 RepID=UPI0028DE1060|nr:TetR/AcrR family transcriptional regulator [Curvibacter sp. APW13]MDT8991816.1 TetR/AcrR family transcriptional regulator [Curvibacter sp. APW13]